ncbi:hypothetical protein B0H14DRAFT_3158376 [Mycena olivaceomarginata]|nr:hypothetical protein B0H14DRAFT_3158376 [Mycena olivaceomarginata]
MKEYRQRRRIWRSEMRQPTAAIGGPTQIPEWSFLHERQHMEKMADAIDVLAREFGAESKRRVKMERVAWCKACMSRRPNEFWYRSSGWRLQGTVVRRVFTKTAMRTREEIRISEISESSVPTLIATSTKVVSTKGETLPKRNAAARQRQAAVTADRVRRFRRLTTTVEKIHAVNISDGDKEHAAPAQTTAS